MPAWLLALIKLAIQVGGPALLSYLKGLIEKNYPDFAKILEDLIKGLNDPSSSNSAARKSARKACDGIGCSPDLKRS